MRQEVGEVTTAEKEALIAAILDTDSFAPRGKQVRGQRGREILKYLFNRHIQNPSDRVTESDIFRDVFGEEPDISSTKVRTAIVRLRGILGKYFRSIGAYFGIGFTIPTGTYALEFYRRPNDRDIFDWFWESYLEPGINVDFGLVLPDLARSIDFSAYLRAYSRFAEMLGDFAKHLPVLPRSWQEEAVNSRDYFNKGCYLFLGGESAVVPDQGAHVPSEYKNSVPPSGALRFLSGFPTGFKMFRDPSGHTAVSIANTEKRSGQIRCESPDERLVLFTRITVRPYTTIALLTSRLPEAIAAVADFMTSDSGLQAIAAHPAFGGTSSGLPACPEDLSIIFSVTQTKAESHHFSSAPGERFSEVAIVDCYWEVLRRSADD